MTTSSKMLLAALSATLLPLALASPLDAGRRWLSAASYVGVSTSDVFPPTSPSATVDPALFPSEPVIGYPGPTPTGVEPFAIQTAKPSAGYPANTKDTSTFPLVIDRPYGNNDSSSDFNIFRTWGNLAPWYSVPSSTYGLDSASPLIPDGCSITQVHMLYRHGARYPTSGAAPSTFAAELHNATLNGTLKGTGDLEFINDWTYKLGAELLTPFGRLQNFELGVEARQLYGGLLNNFTEQGVLPVFRTESEDRMVKTAQNFAAGFFGVPEFLTEVNLEIIVEAEGFNDTGAPYDGCTNANVASRGSIGSGLATKFANNAFNGTLARLQSQLQGYTLKTSDAIAMLQLCSYETVALGYSQFCRLFTQEDFENYEYYYDLSFYYNNGYGSPVAAAQGKGFLEEFLARLQHQPLSEYNSTTNSTLDNDPRTFPLNQSIYADATHEVVVLDTLTAFNLSALFPGGPPPIDVTTRPSPPTDSSRFVASHVVPFATHFVIQVLECPQCNPSKQIRFIVNDAVVPLDKTYEGCPVNQDGLCGADMVFEALRKRVKEIDFDYACFGN